MPVSKIAAGYIFLPAPSPVDKDKAINTMATG